MAVLGGEEPEGTAPLSPFSLSFARRDLDRLRLLLAAQSRLRELHTSPRVKQMLAGRGYLEEALRWLEIHGGVGGRELAERWRGLEAAEGAADDETEEMMAAQAPRRRRRRRRRRRPPRPPGESGGTA
jgi:hypothetical protein